MFATTLTNEVFRIHFMSNKVARASTINRSGRRFRMLHGIGESGV